MRKPLSSNYRYDWNIGLDNHMVVVGIPSGYDGNMIDMEFNILSRWMWGLGASLSPITYY